VDQHAQYGFLVEPEAPGAVIAWHGRASPRAVTIRRQGLRPMASDRSVLSVGLPQVDNRPAGYAVVDRGPLRVALFQRVGFEVDGGQRLAGLFNAQYMTRMARIALMPPKAMRCRPSETL
jgi:hypothetical protein